MKKRKGYRHWALFKKYLICLDGFYKKKTWSLSDLDEVIDLDYKVETFFMLRRPPVLLFSNMTTCRKAIIELWEQEEKEISHEM